MDMHTEAQLKRRIRDGLGQAWEGLVDMIDEIHKSRREAGSRADHRRTIELTIDVFLESIELPWGVPAALLKPALVAALTEALARRSVENGV
jgi:hypothetical protein